MLARLGRQPTTYELTENPDKEIYTAPLSETSCQSTKGSDTHDVSSGARPSRRTRPRWCAPRLNKADPLFCGHHPTALSSSIFIVTPVVSQTAPTKTINELHRFCSRRTSPPGGIQSMLNVPFGSSDVKFWGLARPFPHFTDAELTSTILEHVCPDLKRSKLVRR